VSVTKRHVCMLSEYLFSIVIVTKLIINYLVFVINNKAHLELGLDTELDNTDPMADFSNKFIILPSLLFQRANHILKNIILCGSMTTAK